MSVTQTLQKESGTPLYLQLAGVLRSAILSAALKPGEALPTERVLCERHGVSRATVREAIGQLKLEGCVETRHGSGNFVRTPKVDRDLLRVHDFNVQIEQSGQRNRAEIQQYDPNFRSENIASILRIDASSTLLKVTRLRLAGDTPLFIETLYLERSRFAQEDETSLSSTDLILGRFRKKYGIRIGEVVLELEPVLLSEQQAEHLAVVELPAAGLLNKRTSYDGNGVPALYAEWLFAAGRCRHTLTLKSD